jgi:hypothetical protein
VKRWRVALLSIALTGCYEGWTPPPAGSAPPSPSTTPSPPAAKPIGYVLFEPITMDTDAIQSDTCFPRSGIRQFRTNEWSERIASITTALGNLADTVESVPINVPAADCGTLASVQAAAVASTPWGSAPSPESAPSGTVLLHLTAVFWDGGPTTSPPSVVPAVDWVPWQTLKGEGLNAKSLSYFVLSDPDSGYFASWQQAEPAGTSLTGTPINQVDPTAAGITARDALVTSDTAALMQWIQGQLP